MSSVLDALHRRMAELEAWKDRVGPDLVSAVQRFQNMMAEIDGVLAAARKELGDLGIQLPPGKSAAPTPAPTNQGEPKP